METNLPNPTTARVYVNLPEGKIHIRMDPGVPSERKYDWGMMTRGSAVPSQTVAMDP